MSRKALGIIAALLLVVGGITAVSGPGGTNANAFAGGCIRVGLVLGALWLALPQIQAALRRLPGWVMGWFVGKDKPGEAKAQNEAPVMRVKRPRRRSSG
jgi:hypothetical protein